MYKLIENEAFKMIGKKRLYIALGILFIMVAAFAYGQYKSTDRIISQIAARSGVATINEWDKIVEQQVIILKKDVDNPYLDEERRARSRVRMEQLQYFLDNDMNPYSVTGPTFITKFLSMTISLFLPLLMILLAADIVSGELGAGTIKLLLVQGVPRWKILLSKYITLLMFEAVVLFFAVAFSFGVAGIFFGFGGWTEPVSTGFKAFAGKLLTSDIVNVPQWKFILMSLGLAYYVSVAVGTVSFMISVLVKSTVASIGIMLSTMLGGALLSRFLEDWGLPRYLFVTNLNLIDYISGSLRPVVGMNMSFSICVLGIWIIGSIGVSFVYFSKRDILV